MLHLTPLHCLTFTILSITVACAGPAVASPILQPRQGLTRTYVVHNKCPKQINLFVGGQQVNTLPTGGSLTRVDNVAAGFWYTDLNGGRYTGVGTTRAAFSTEEYWLIKDFGSINTGLSVAPRHVPVPPDECVPIACNDTVCPQAFTGVPQDFPFPTSGPVFTCPFSNTTFDLTFCPDGKLPPNQGIAIHPNADASKCLDVRGAVFANGTPVQIFDCNGTPAQNWFFVRGSTKIQLANTNFCLDAGSNPANGVGLKIWQCFDNLPAQQWFFTNDNRIALENQGQCVDLTNGILTNANQVQTWKCTDFNTNQIWNI
ncbi:hypothetical protein CPC08DRAFT_694670 [Agrocybe pediades]|nr:hypothetical protein CPC08DRAFT_694670 [Agrocybe pediades]